MESLILFMSSLVGAFGGSFLYSLLSGLYYRHKMQKAMDKFSNDMNALYNQYYDSQEELENFTSKTKDLH